jgi:phosphoglycolate phosphatase-like HAD superfamily hydrolase
MLAGRLAGVPVIGYANKPGKAGLLRQAGADAVTTGMDEITTVLRLAPPPGVRG